MRKRANKGYGRKKPWALGANGFYLKRFKYWIKVINPPHLFRNRYDITPDRS